MNDELLLTRLKRNLLHNKLISALTGSWLQLVVVLGFGLFFWWGLFYLFHTGFSFLKGYDAFLDQVVQAVMNVLFLSLVLMLCFSNGIISYVSFFRSEETSFLMASPLRPGTIYLYKLTETMAFSSWAFLFLAGPLLVAYGQFAEAPWYFYVFTAVLIVCLTFLPAAIGSVCALIVGRWAPERKGHILGLFIVLGATIVGGGLWVLYSFSPPADVYTREWIQTVLNQLSFAQHPLLPSAWASQGMIQFGRGSFGSGFFNILLLLSNGLVGILGGYYMSEWVLTEAWGRAGSSDGGGRDARSGVLSTVLDGVCWFFPTEARTLLRKDLLGFLRDPAQWSQMLIFFGLLGVYFFNLREFSLHENEEWWRLVISFLNLGATGLTLASFTSRFIYPQFSLEGRRFWVVGMAPMSRSTLILSKFFYSLLFTLGISIPLIVLSVFMLNLTRVYLLLEILTIVGICVGLSAMAVGLGTMYPDFTSDDPSKIVSGFGGTLNLMLSILYVLLMLTIGAVPVYLYKMGGEFWFDISPQLLFSVFIMLGAVVTMIASVVPLKLGIGALKRLEV